jgi:hypothetical protein
MRLSSKEIENAIFIPRKEKAEVEQGEVRTTLVYTLAGQEDELIDERGNTNKQGYPSLWDVELKDGTIKNAEKLDNAFAKTHEYRGKQRFYIKQNKDGNFINPVNGMEDEITSKKKQTKYVGKDDYVFREVGYNTFMLYLKFLKTKNIAYLTQAEREDM